MINLLPSETRRQIVFSQYNVIARRYLIILLLIALVTGGALYVSHSYADHQIADYESNLQNVRAQTRQYKDLEQSVQTLNSRTQTIRTLLNQRPQFSVLLADLAQVLPSNSYLNGISLSQDRDKPLELTVTVPSREHAVQLRQALLRSPRISAADIQSIDSQDRANNKVNVSVVITFNTQKPGDNEGDGGDGADESTDNGDGDQTLENATGSQEAES